MGIDLPDYLDECDYEYWLKLDLVTIVQISFIACGNEPPRDSRNFFRRPADYQDQHKVYNLLKNAIQANKIKPISKYDVLAKAPPLEWLTHLVRKCYRLPDYLGNFVYHNLPCGIPMEEEDVQRVCVHHQIIAVLLCLLFLVH